MLAMIDDRDVDDYLKRMHVPVDKLAADITAFLDNDLSYLKQKNGEREPKPTIAMQRVFQRAALQVQSSGRDTVTSLHVLIAMFAEPDSYAVYFMQKYGLTRLSAMDYLARSAPVSGVDPDYPEDEEDLGPALDEFCVNYDVRAASQFMYKEKDSIDPLLHAGPPWDYDWSYGNHSDGAKDPELMDYVYKRSGVFWFLTHWLLTHEDFQQATRRAYEEEVYPAAEILLGRKEAPEGSALKTLEEYRAAVADSAAMNFTRWRTGGVPDIYKGSGLSFEEAYAYLQHFIEVRTDALLENWTPGRNE